MFRLRWLTIAGLMVLLGARPAHAMIINLDAKVHVVGGTHDQPLAVLLPADGWLAQPIGTAAGGAFDAYSLWASNQNCTPSCPPDSGNRGWLHRYGARIGATIVIDPNVTWNGTLYADPLDALGASVPAGFGLGAMTVVEFYVPTDQVVGDNRGGISLLLLTPLDTGPTTWGRIKLLYK